MGDLLLLTALFRMTQQLQALVMPRGTVARRQALLLTALPRMIQQLQVRVVPLGAVASPQQTMVLMLLRMKMKMGLRGMQNCPQGKQKWMC